MKSLISKNPLRMGGKPCIRGTRITISSIKSAFDGGDSIELLCSVHLLSQAQVIDAINYGRKNKI